jgi:hypothetical protein
MFLSRKVLIILMVGLWNSPLFCTEADHGYAQTGTIKHRGTASEIEVEDVKLNRLMEIAITPNQIPEIVNIHIRNREGVYQKVNGNFFGKLYEDGKEVDHIDYGKFKGIFKKKGKEVIFEIVRNAQPGSDDLHGVGEGNPCPHGGFNSGFDASCPSGYVNTAENTGISMRRPRTFCCLP